MSMARWRRVGVRLPIAGVAALIASGLLGELAVAQKSGGGQAPAGRSVVESTTVPATPRSPRLDDGADAWAREQLTSGLVGSKHDFTQGGKSGRDLCLPCHTPHLATPPPPRLDRRTATTQPLRPYEGRGAELSGWSLLCLGCHDGVTARDVYSSPHAISVAGQLGNSRLGVAGLRSHPIGVRYPTASDKYEPLAAVEAAGLLLPDGRIQCTSCHDAHNTNRHPGMLRLSNERSRLCLTCHRI